LGHLHRHQALGELHRCPQPGHRRGARQRGAGDPRPDRLALRAAAPDLGAGAARPGRHHHGGGGRSGAQRIGQDRRGARRAGPGPPGGRARGGGRRPRARARPRPVGDSPRGPRRPRDPRVRPRDNREGVSVVLAAAAINVNLANYSNDLIYSAMAVYLLAFLAYAVEWTFGSRSRIALQSAALTARPGATLGQAVAAADAEPAKDGRSKVTVTVTNASGSTATLTRTAVAKAGKVDVVTRGDAEPPADGPGAAGGSERADLLGRMAVSLTALAALLHLGSVVTRGLSAGRPPWGNL